MDATLYQTNEFFEIPPKVTKLASERMVMVFPLSLRHANSYASKRVALNWRCNPHCLARQGVNLGIALGTDIGGVNLLN